MLNQGIGSWTARRARTSPERVALVHGDTTRTYAELHERVLRLASILDGFGVREGDRVAYLGVNHPSLLETLFACGSLGAILVPLNTRLATPELAHIVQDSRPCLLIHGADHTGPATELRSGGHVPQLLSVSGNGPDDYEQRLAAASPTARDEPVQLGDTCMIMYTSGTTGSPKGAMLTHGNLSWNCVNVLLDVDLTADEVTLVTAQM